MFYSKQTGGFYDRAVHGDNMPADVVEITAEEHVSLISGQSNGKIISWGDNGFPFLTDPPTLPPTTPQKVTMRQARLALHNAGKLVDVEAAINILPEPPRTAARIEWDFSSEVHRDKEFVAMISTALGLTDAEMDALFVQAALL